MSIRELADAILLQLGGKNNIIDAENCMTRIRVSVNDSSKVDVEKIKSIEGVLGVVSDDGNYFQIVLGPGRVRDVMSLYVEDGIKEKLHAGETAVTNDWEKNKANLKGKQKDSNWKQSIRVIADIFTPMIPAFIASGVTNGLGRLLKILMTNGTIPTNQFTELSQNMIALIGSGFLAYLVIFTGVNAAKQFRVNPMLGGMIGAAAIDGNINKISQIIGWFNEEVPNKSILSSGAGGVIGVIVGVWVLAKIEKWVPSKMPYALDISFTPLLSMLITMPIFVLLIMPVTGFISIQLSNFLGLFVNSTNPVVSVITGYVLAASFLPLVLVGLHRGLTPIYTLQIESLGFTTLFPAVAMAGAGQVGAAIALYIKAKRLKNKNMQAIISGAIPAGILGIGEPLIYGVTLPLLKPFITAGLGAGFGGAYVMLMGVGSTAFSPSGLLATTHVLPEFALHFVIGILISYIMGAIITYFFIPDSMILPE
ncbi:MAG: PTS transporter subunit EIIC [Erysipelothrix sp.]|nr:PTS transporter subunit EIIC [Erysipelothrix sp.]